MLFPNNDSVFQDDSSPIHTVRNVNSWFEEHEDALQHLLWPTQSPDLKIIYPLWSVLESRVRSRFPSSSVKQLDVLREDWYSIPLQTIQNLKTPFQEGRKLYYRQMVVQFCINIEMCMFHNCFHPFAHPLHAWIFCKFCILCTHFSYVHSCYTPFTSLSS